MTRGARLGLRPAAWLEAALALLRRALRGVRTALSLLRTPTAWLDSTRCLRRTALALS